MEMIEIEKLWKRPESIGFSYTKMMFDSGAKHMYKHILENKT